MDSAGGKRVSVIIPCHDEETTVGAFLERLQAVAAGEPGRAFEFLFIDDGSRDHTNARVRSLIEREPRAGLITLSRNFGHQNAITAGLEFCSGDYAIIIDADAQDPPEEIPRILEALDAGHDLVHMVRSARPSDSALKKVSAHLFYIFMRRYVLPELPQNAPDFKGCNRRVLEALRRYPERVRFMRGLMATLGFKQTRLYYVREPRHAGVSAYSFHRIMRLARDAVVSFSVLPVRTSFYVGLATLLATGLYAAVSLAAWLGGAPMGQPAARLLIGLAGAYAGFVLVILGLIGEYLGVLMREVKQRPLYTVESVVNVPPAALPPRSG